MEDCVSVLAPYVKIGLQNGQLFLGFGSIQRSYKDPAEIDLVTRIAEAWRTPQTPQQVINRFNRSHPADLIDRVIATFIDGHYLIPSGSFDSQNRHSRHELFFALSGADAIATQARLHRKHVLILGCGGIGNILALSLATAGIGRLTLVDHDQIELSNLTRQIAFREADVGASKVTTLREALLQRASNVEVDVLDLRISNPNDLSRLSSADLFLLSADSPRIVDWTNAYCVRNRIPFLNACYIEDIAVWGPFVIPRKTGCWGCHNVVASTAEANTHMAQLMQSVNSGYRPPSFGPLNYLAASLATMDAIKFLGEFGEVQSLNKRIGLWTHSLKLETQDFSRNPECQVCGDNSDYF